MKNGLVAVQTLKVKTLKQVDRDRCAFDASTTDDGPGLCVQRKDVGRLRRMGMVGDLVLRRVSLVV